MFFYFMDKRMVIPGFLVLTNRERTPPWVFSSRGTWSILKALNYASIPTSNLRYLWRKGYFSWDFPFIWETTNSKLFRTLMHFTPISSTCVMLTMIASYSTWLLVVENLSLIDTSTNKPELFSKITHASFPYCRRSIGEDRSRTS